MEEQIAQELTVDTVFVEQNIVNENKSVNNQITAPFSYLDGDNHDWIMEYSWGISDGRWLEEPLVEPYNWIGYMTPLVRFYKFEIPTNSILYQERLRRDRFTLMYQTEERDKLYGLETTTSYFTGVYDLGFNSNYSFLSLIKDGINYSRQNRVGEQTNLDHPLVGIWGSLPFLTEYRIVDTVDSVYYMEINKPIPYWAIRVGNYLLRQIDEKTFETVSAFPDGLLRLEIVSDRSILLRPLFELPEDEEGLADLLVMNRGLVRLSELTEEDLNPYQW
jgi:hypothetical protein